MTDDEILALAALTSNEPTDAEMIAFARAIAAKEREACVKVCEESRDNYDRRANSEPRTIDPEVARVAIMTCDFIAHFIAHDIRARGENNE